MQKWYLQQLEALARFLLRECAMYEILKNLAVKEFGTLEGVTITYSIDRESGRVNYCLMRK